MKQVAIIGILFSLLLAMGANPIHSESGKLLILVSPDSDQSYPFLSLDSESESEIQFQKNFPFNPGLSRIMISREKILSIPVPTTTGFLGSDSIFSYDWKTGSLSESKHPMSTGIKILRSFLIDVGGDLESTIYQELHSNGDERLFQLKSGKPMYLSHFDKFRKTAVFDDIISSGAHVFHILTKDKTVQKLESSYTRLKDGFSQKLYYCSSIVCKPEEILSDKAIFNARLINNGKQIVFLTPVGLESDAKIYNLESYDILTKKRTKHYSFKTKLKFPSGKFFNLGNPTLRVFQNSNLVLFTEELSEKGEDYIPNWKLANLETGKIEDFKVPEGCEWAPMLPVSYHTNTSTSDVSAMEPFVVFVKNRYLAEGTEYSFKVVQLSEKKTILDTVFTSKATLLNAIYVSDTTFLNQK